MNNIVKKTLIVLGTILGVLFVLFLGVLALYGLLFQTPEF